MLMLRTFLLSTILFAVLAASRSTVAQTADLPGADQASADQEARIAQLIAQLGDTRYGLRIKAQEDLLGLGFQAFDALTAAEENDDVEIATQARFLTRRIRVQWTADDDPAAIRALFQDYDQKDEEERRRRIKRLAEQPQAEGLRWLCRVVRFEQSAPLSKEAALAAINALQPDETWPARAAVIKAALDRGVRPGARWLRAYLLEHDDPNAALAVWKRLIAEERSLFLEHPRQSSPELIAELLKHEVKLHDSLGKFQDADAAIQEILSLERGDSETLLKLVDWLRERKAWQALADVTKRFAESFEADGLLLYALADAYRQGERTTDAEQAAARAKALNPGNTQYHLDVARRLLQRGLFEYAETEFQAVIATGPPQVPAGVLARIMLSESLHERKYDERAAEVLRPLVELIEKDKVARLQVQRVLGQIGREESAAQARYYFFQGLVARQKDDLPNAGTLLNRAVTYDPKDADVLIALYRLPTDDKVRKAKIAERVRTTVAMFRAEIDSDPDSPLAYNQLAWLVGNTEGDFDEAINFSHKSIDLCRSNPDDRHNVGGYLDTLGHCYFAKKDYENAVRYQSEAYRLEPHSVAIKRQLDNFEKALADSRAQKGAGNAGKPEGPKTEPPNAEAPKIEAPN